MKIQKLMLAGAVAAALTLPAVAADRSGKEVVDTVCASCHARGEGGAPKIGDRAAWSQRASKGLDKLTANAISGVRNMPAHGGQANLSDVEMSRAVAYMVSDGKAVDTHQAYTSPLTRSGEQVYQQRCQDCHADGSRGAPKFADREAWKPRLGRGVPTLVKSAIAGHNNMPARGGMVDLSDAEMRAAVEYMVAALGSGK